MPEHAPTFTDLGYRTGGGSSVNQRLDLWRPDGDAAYPTLLWLSTEDPPETLGPGMEPRGGAAAYFAREAGCAVAWARISDLGFDPGEPDDPERDAAHAVCYLRDNAATLGIHPSRVVVWGQGRAASAAAWPTLGEEIGPALGSASSSRPTAAVLDGLVADWPSMRQSSTLTRTFNPNGGYLTAVPGPTQEAASPARYVTDEGRLVPIAVLQTEDDEDGGLAPGFAPDTIEGLESWWHARALRSVFSAEDLVRKRFLDASPEGIYQPGRAVDVALDWAMTYLGRAPAEELAIRRVEDALRRISHANGYATDVQSVERVRGHFWPLPCIRVASLSSDYFDRGASTQTRSHNSVRIGLALVNSGWERHETRASQFIADVRRAFAEAAPQYQADLPDWEALVTRSERFTANDPEPNRQDRKLSGATVQLSVEFRDPWGDPYTEA